MTTPTRDRIVFATAELLRRQGYAATGMKQVTTLAEAPFGSLYHFFPGGKEALADEVLRTGGRFFLELFRYVMDEAEDLVSGVDAFFRGAGETLETTNYQDACPIGTVALEVASTNDTLRRATHEAFESWVDEATARLESAGATDARGVALSLICLIEGGFMLSRAAQSTEPMDAARRTAVLAVEAALSP